TAWQASRCASTGRGVGEARTRSSSSPGGSSRPAPASTSTRQVPQFADRQENSTGACASSQTSIRRPAPSTATATPAGLARISMVGILRGSLVGWDAAGLAGGELAHERLARRLEPLPALRRGGGQDEAL